MKTALRMLIALSETHLTCLHCSNIAGRKDQFSFSGMQNLLPGQRDLGSQLQVDRGVEFVFNLDDAHDLVRRHELDEFLGKVVLDNNLLHLDGKMISHQFLCFLVGHIVIVIGKIEKRSSFLCHS